jgi:hypothetical protein
MATTRCGRCDSPLVEISIVRGESTVSMRSCSTCDTRSWEADGRLVGLPDILEAVGKK